MKTPRWLLMPGDVVDVLRTMPDASADAALLDPPYGLGREPTPAQLAAYVLGERLDLGGDFMGKSWDVPPVAFWRELRRVLKPGAPILAFAGPRTADLITLGMRAAGIEIRDVIGHAFPVEDAIAEFVGTLDEHQRRAFDRAFVSSPLLAWMHGQGFPKSLDVSKAIDRMRDDRDAVLKVTAFVRAGRDAKGYDNTDLDAVFGTNGMAGHWTIAASQPAVPTVEQWAVLKECLDLTDEMDAEVARLNERKGTPGEAFAERPVTGAQDVPDFREVRPVEGLVDAPRRLAEITGAAQDVSAQWEGFGTALKPAWEPIIVGRVPIDGTVAHNALEHGVGALNIDGCRIGFQGDEESPSEARREVARRTGNAPVNREQQSPKNGRMPDRVDAAIYTATRPSESIGRWPSNVVLTHASTCIRTGTRPIARGGGIKRVDSGMKSGSVYGTYGEQRTPQYGGVDGTGEIEAWTCAPGCPVAELDRQSGDRPGMSGGGAHRPDYPGGVFGTIDSVSTARGDAGGASRFFFTAKASRSEREFGCEDLPARKGTEAVDREEGSAGTKSPRAGAGRTADKVRNYHPTVKPIALVKWLATLILPLKRVEEPRRILIPYAGSGSEMIGDMRAGWDQIIGIQRQADDEERGYLEIARVRLERWSQVRDDIDEAETIAMGKRDSNDDAQPSLFGTIERETGT